MIDLAINHEKELKKKFRLTWFSNKYKFWNNSYYYEEVGIDQNTHNRHQFVSLNKEGEVIGYVAYTINRASESVNGLSMVNFSDDKISFGKDSMSIIKDIFEKFNFRKISFSVVIGNPIEKSYDRLIKRYNGRIIGIKKENTKLFDGKYYDLKLYEILLKDYKCTKV